MKTLDVQALHKAIDHTLEQLKHQSDEFAKVKKAVESITSLDDALKGKGGDAIRAFYEECHTPFLQFYDTFIEEYSSTLKKMKSALNSLEPNHNGFISQTFLEHELEQGVNAADRTTKRLVSKTNATIAKVSHIVDLPDLNDSGFHEQNQKALKEINQTIEKLHAFDREQTSALKTAENDLETMHRYISRLEKMYTGPKIEITGYQKGSILKPDEMDTLRGGQDTAMGVMLDKLDKRSKLEKEVSEVSEHDVQLYKLRKKLENTSDSAEYLKIAKEIGYDNLTPEQMEHVKSIEFWNDPLQTTIDNIKETGKGFIDGIVDAGEKLDEAGEKYLGPVYKSAKGSAVAGYDLAKDFVDGGIQLGWNIGWTIDHLHKDPQVVLDTVLEYDYKGAFMSMVDTLAEKWDEKVVHGDAYSRAHYFTYMIGSLWGLKSGKSSVSTGSKDLAKAGKAAVNKAKKAGKTIKQSIKPPNNRYTPALQGILQDAPNSINVKNTPLIRELVEDKKKSVLFKSTSGKVNPVAKGKNETIKKFTKEQLATKPKNSPVPEKWEMKGGKVEIDKNGTWVYTNKHGQTVRYPDGYPDFTPYMHPTVKPVEIEISKPTNRPADYKKANIEAGLNKDSDPPVPSLNRPPSGYIWHHHQDGKTMILVEKDIHREFTHAGGVSTVNGK
ncbi:MULTISPECIES: T7SS effector LXG polymorphic toxin [Bacillus]|uniref:T7SS effector LXG polymorphic toxin n=1 Tax=Bacillus TaxID=1386 RepID=UPI002281C96C|nr:T7SS effector LXG polymorphic toxin [Bacillus haynesii]MCY8435085.1 T7SS effector LXG polymorphic toxin [Bacillus haynesii]MCY9158396.1 T7SS effector LXG polymorphic toxin [Bacillus haynesii]MCY9452707.1 T7SS effector LXG polymorphic toxin [Bacillus haynesii]